MSTKPVRWIFLPYCIRRLGDGRYIVLNRQYKPLGISSDAWVTYETDPSAQQIKITPAAAKRMSWKESDDLESIYLYSDSCIPTESAEHLSAYAKRLAAFMQLAVEVP